MTIIFVLAASILLQLTAAFLALRLISVTGRRAAWIAIATAVVLMAVRRSITLYRTVSGDPSYPPDLSAELVALVISILMVAGIAWIGPLFRTIQQSQQKLRESEERFRGLAQAAGDAIITIDAGGRIRFFNAAAEHIFGYAAEEITDREVGALIPEEYEDRHKTALRRYLETGQATILGKTVELKGRRKDGEVFPLELSLSEVRADGEITFTAILRDITARRRAEERLKLQSTALEAAANGIIITDREGTIVWVNPAFTELTGYTAEEAIGQNPRILKSGEQDEAFYEELWDSIMAGQVWRGETVNRREDGSLYTEEQTITPVRNEHGEITHFIAIKQDVTAQVQAERALRESEEKYRSVVERANDGITILQDSIVQYANPRLVDLWDGTVEEVIGTPFTDYVHPDALPQVMDRYQRRMAGEDVPALYETKLRRKDGQPADAEINAATITYKGEPADLVIVRDITARKRAEEEIHRLNQFQASIIDDARLWLDVLDEEGNVVVWNRAAEEISGYSREEVVGHDEVWQWLYPDEAYRGEVKAYVNTVLETGETVEGFETTIRCKDGQTRIMSWNSRRMLDETGAPMGSVVLGNDVTERKQAEEALHRHAQRLETLREIDRAILQARSTEEIARVATRRVRELVSCQRASIALFDFEADEFAAFTSSSEGPTQVEPDARSRLETFGGDIEDLKAGKVNVVEDVRDLSQPPAAIQKLQAEGLRAYVNVPLLAQDELFGSLNLGGDRPHTFSAEDLEIARAVADQLAIAMRQARLLAETEEALAREQRLTDIARTLNRTLDLSSVLTNVVRQAVELVDAGAGALALVDPDGQAISYRHLFNLPDALSRQASPQGEGLAWHIVETGESVLIPEYGQHPEALPQWVEAGVRAFAGVPIVAGKHRIGAVGVFSLTPDKRFSQRNLALLEGVGQQAGIAIQNARLHQQTERRLQHLDALRQIDMAITASLDLRVTLSVILDQVTAQLGVDAADVLLLKPHTQTLEHAVGRGFQTDALQHTRLQLGEGYAGRAAYEQRIVSIPNLAEIDNSLKRSPQLPEEDFVSYYAVPLVAKDQVQGVLEIFHRELLTPNQEWLDFLEALGAQAAIAIDNARLFDDLQRSNTELRLAYNTTLEGWARALELRDMETEGHSRRVTEMTMRLGHAMDLSDEKLVHVRRGALLHDVGKIGVPDSILLKPDGLTDEEWEIVHQHPVYAYQLLSPIPFLRPALDIPYCHHEKWDGSGYPRGLREEQIPLPARIFAVADVYDALTSNRPYRDAWPEEKALAYIRDEAGSHFDPEVVEAFFEVLEHNDGRLKVSGSRPMNGARLGPVECA